MLDRCSNAIGLELDDRQMERYWKDQSKFRVICSAHLQMPSRAEAVVEVLTRAGTLADKWCVGPPQEYSDQSWEFEGIATGSHFSVPGVTFAEFRIRSR